jgi:acyltransferase
MNRLEFLDVAKGLGIMLVLFGHILPSSTIVFKIIYSFHMPLFFIISGYLFNIDKYTIKDVVVKKFKRYIIPYFVIAFVCLLFFGRDSLLMYFGGILYSYGNLEYMPNCSPLWFLTCLYLTEILLIVILKKSPKPYIFIGIILLIGIIYNQTFHYRLPWNLDVSLIAIGFMYMGYLIKGYKILEHYKHKYSVLLLLMAVVSITYNSTISMNGRMYGNFLLTFISGITISLLVLYYCKYIKKSKILYFFGNNSMFIMGYNYAFNTLYFGYLYMFSFVNHWIVVGTNIVIFAGMVALFKNKIKLKIIEFLNVNKKIDQFAYLKK